MGRLPTLPVSCRVHLDDGITHSKVRRDPSKDQISQPYARTRKNAPCRNLRLLQGMVRTESVVQTDYRFGKDNGPRILRS